MFQIIFPLFVYSAGWESYMTPRHTTIGVLWGRGGSHSESSLRIICCLGVIYDSQRHGYTLCRALRIRVHNTIHYHTVPSQNSTITQWQRQKTVPAAKQYCHETVSYKTVQLLSVFFLGRQSPANFTESRFKFLIPAY